MRTMYTVLPIEKYNELNQKITEALGYAEGCNTVIYSEKNPVIVDGYAVMMITSEVQELHSDLLIGVELICDVPINNTQDETDIQDS